VTDEGKKLLEAALGLAPKERAEIAARLVESVNSMAAAEQAWNAEVEVRAQRALASELCPVYYLGRSPVPMRFDADAELDLERALPRHAGLLDDMTAALERILEAPGKFGLHPALPDTLGVRRCHVREHNQTILYVCLAKEVRILAVADKYHLPGDGDVTLESLVAVEDWLGAAGLRVASFLALGAVVAIH
jgi:hypothetical protein